MEPWYKFILYGTYDGFSRSTLGDDNLYLVLENGETVEVPRCFVKKASDFIEKDKLKLKDVIARIKKLDLDAQKVWLNEILNELGSDYGTLKYKSGYEQGRLEGEWVGQQLKDADKIRQELNEPTVLPFVADWIEACKEHLPISLYTAMNPNFMKQNNQSSDLMLWIEKSSNQEIFARAWLDGYTVEKEKRYRVKAKGVGFNSCLIFEKINKTWFFSSIYETDHQRVYHTKKELKDAGFGEVFNSPLVEVEEVE